MPIQAPRERPCRRCSTRTTRNSIKKASRARWVASRKAPGASSGAPGRGCTCNHPTGLHRVWLERDGHLVFEPEAPFDLKTLGQLEVTVSRPEVRASIEVSWIQIMILAGWLELEWESEHSFVLSAYPGLPGAFRRHVELRAPADQASPRALRALRPQDLGLGPGVLKLWGHWLLLPQLLWGHRDRVERVSASCCLNRCCSGIWSEQAECWAVTCSGRSCKVAECSATEPEQARRSPSRVESSREAFKLAVQDVLRRALLLDYRAVLIAQSDIQSPTDGRGDPPSRQHVIRLLEAELVPLLAMPADSWDGRRAYAEVVLSFADDTGIALRHGAERLAERENDSTELPGLCQKDTLDFWRTVDEVLESDAATRHRAFAPKGGFLLEPTELGAEWDAEIQRRIERIDAGLCELHPADEVFAELERKYSAPDRSRRRT
jgi:hypothetical protein